MTTTGNPATDIEPDRVRLNRPVLVGNLVSGVLLLSLFAVFLSYGLFGSWPLLLIGAVYVVAGGAFLAAVYAHEVLTMRQEALAWTAPWLVAVALWTGIAIDIEFENQVSHYLFGLYVGLLIGTPCYLVWQIVALAVRRFIAWRSGRWTLPA